MKRCFRVAAAALGLLAHAAPAAAAPAPADAPPPLQLINASYDPTRELYDAINPAFALWWKDHSHGQQVSLRTSHGGSGAQSRAILDGLEADVATLALAYDIDVLADKGHLLPADWQKSRAFNSSPYTSTIVLLVRKGNPKRIRDWADLVRPGVQVITANPKTSGGARWNFLAAWAYGRRHGGEAGARAYVKKLYAHVPVLDSGARGATNTFAERGQGDVLIAWENEALLAARLKPEAFEVVTPSISVLAEPPVAVLTANARKHGTEAVANAYLNFLYSPWAQEIIVRNYYRPRNRQVAARYAQLFPKLALVTVDHDFGGWRRAQQTFFRDGGVFDQIRAQ